VGSTPARGPIDWEVQRHLPHVLVKPLTGERIERGKRLVEEEQRRLGGQCPRDGNALLLPAADLPVANAARRAALTASLWSSAWEGQRRNAPAVADSGSYA
jgi:hypothetical protein